MAEKLNDLEIFEGKTLSSLFEDIYNNTNSRKKTINDIINVLESQLNEFKDAVMLGPIIQTYLEVAVNNDEQLIKLAQVLQRIIAAKKDSSDDGVLSEDEKEQLLNMANKSIDDLKADADKLTKKLKDIERGNDGVQEDVN